MIVRSSISAKVGSIYRDWVLIINGESKIATFQILRAASYEEYLKDCVINGRPDCTHTLSPGDKFYLISMG